MLSLLLCMGLAAQAQPNVLIVVADDLGAEWIGAYGEDFLGASTPNIDAMAAGGLLFRRAYANPMCSSSRALLNTGRYGFRSGIGFNLQDAAGTGLYDATAIPSFLGPGYRAGWRGKWHLLDESQSLDHPLALGWDTQWGSRAGIGQPSMTGINCPAPLNYDRFVELRDGEEVCVETYATTHTVDTAIDLIDAWSGRPWVVVVAPTAPHGPFHEPDEELCPEACPIPGGVGGSKISKMRAMVEALDTEFGRLLEFVPDNTYVVFTSDNGTSAFVALGAEGECGGPDKVKGTLYQGGTRVPFIVCGPGVPKGHEVDALVQLTDLAATVSDLTGGNCDAEDSISFAPVLLGRKMVPREWAYTEIFSPNNEPLETLEWSQAVTDGEWKLIRHLSQAVEVGTELYHLPSDPCETKNLASLQGRGSEDRLRAVLVELTGV